MRSSLQKNNSFTPVNGMQEELESNDYGRARTDDDIADRLRAVENQRGLTDANAGDESELRQDGRVAPVEKVQSERAGDVQQGRGYRGVQENNGVNAEAPDEGASSVKFSVGYENTENSIEQEQRSISNDDPK